MITNFYAIRFHLCCHLLFSFVSLANFKPLRVLQISMVRSAICFQVVDTPTSTSPSRVVTPANSEPVRRPRSSGVVENHSGS